MWIYSLQFSILFQQKTPQHSALEYHVRVFLASTRYMLIWEYLPSYLFLIDWVCRDDNEWWIFPVGLVLCKLFQSQLINWHVANLEIQDRSLYSNDFELFWQS
jgi:hypothetical protein